MSQICLEHFAKKVIEDIVKALDSP